MGTVLQGGSREKGTEFHENCLKNKREKSLQSLPAAALYNTSAKRGGLILGRSSSYSITSFRRTGCQADKQGMTQYPNRETRGGNVMNGVWHSWGILKQVVSLISQAHL